MQRHTTIDGDRFFEFQSGNYTSVTLKVKRYSAGIRASIFVFGTYGICGVIYIDDSSNGKVVTYYTISGQALTTSVTHNERNDVEFKLYNLGIWGSYTFIGCNCWFV